MMFSFFLSPLSTSVTCVTSLINPSPLHLSAPAGLIETTETLLSLGASGQSADTQGVTPLLACAPSGAVALCMAMLLEEYLKSDTDTIKRSRKALGKNNLTKDFLVCRQVEDWPRIFISLVVLR